MIKNMGKERWKENDARNKKKEAYRKGDRDKKMTGQENKGTQS